MTNREFFLLCWKDEYPVFLKSFQAIPPEKFHFRPSPNARSTADLVWLQVVEKQCWFELLETGQIHWKMEPPVLSLGEMIAAYQRAHADLALRLEQVDDETWMHKPTQFLVDGKVFFETSMGHMFWLGLFDAIHHRGQLTVHLRAMGAKVPAIYGPSGDDPTDLHHPFYWPAREGRLVIAS